MNVLLDWMLIIIGTLIVYFAYKKIVFQKNTSISNFILVIIYVFCVVPILLNYIIGIPKYNTVYWYKVFIGPMNNENVSIMYDIYILVTMICLYLFVSRKNKKIELKEFNTFTSLTSNKIIATLFIISPIILIVCSGTFKNYMTFNVSSVRGLSEENLLNYMTPLLLLSTITYFSCIFKGRMCLKKVLISVVYFTAIVWISGKRFMIANILILSVFYMNNMNITEKTKKRMFYMLPMLIIMLIVFSAFYLIKVRPLSHTSASSIYEMLRVDFGRDDVIKYVINQEIILNNRILEYRGQTIIGLMASFIPRILWINKPYPHYMYLTGSILGLSIFNLPAGTTPSWFEMCICNFSLFGFIIGIISILLLCKLSDGSKDIDSKALCLLLIVVLLTQSIDVYLIVIALLFFTKLFMNLFKKKTVKFVWGRQNVKL